MQIFKFTEICADFYNFFCTTQWHVRRFVQKCGLQNCADLPLKKFPDVILQKIKFLIFCLSYIPFVSASPGIFLNILRISVSGYSLVFSIPFVSAYPGILSWIISSLIYWGWPLTMFCLDPPNSHQKLLPRLWLNRLNVGWVRTETHSNEANSWILNDNLKAYTNI